VCAVDWNHVLLLLLLLVLMLRHRRSAELNSTSALVTHEAAAGVTYALLSVQQSTRHFLERRGNKRNDVRARTEQQTCMDYVNDVMARNRAP